MDPKLVEMQGNSNSIIPDDSDDQITHLALDIGVYTRAILAGSLIKLAYFTRNSDIVVDDEAEIATGEINAFPNVDMKYHLVHGRLNFAKFETSKITDCLRFISSKKLYLGGCQHHKSPTGDNIIVKATGGGAHKFSDLFKEKLGICFEKEDEMDSLVCGANILLKAVHQEAFTYMNGQKEYVQIDNDLYPYLLVNIGSGVSMIKVDGDSKFERVSGTSIGGGTFWGLGRLLTKCKSFDELLELSQQGDNRVVDVLVGDIFGRMGYPKIGLTSSTIASSFGKAISSNKELEYYKPEDISRSLLRMISNNIGQIAYMNALRFGLKRIFFGGFFIHGHAYTMDTISVAVDYWSKGDAKAMFLRHEGFLGAMGAFMSFKKHGSDDFVQKIRSSTSCDADKMQSQQNGDLYDNQSIELECSVCACL